MMKKLMVAAVLVAFTGLASATELGVNVSRNFGGTENVNGPGMTLGQKFGDAGVTLGFDKYTNATMDQNRYSLVGSYNVAKFGTTSLALKAGAGYLSNQATVANGFVALVGVGVEVPMMKNVALTFDYLHQVGETRVKAFNGNTLNAGIKVSF